MAGWLCLHRKLQQSTVWNLEPFSRGQAWVDLLLSANYQPGTLLFRGISVPIQRGQVGLSEETLASKWKWSRGKVRRFLIWLESEGQIVQQKNNVCSLLTIVNYESYQTLSTADDTANSTANGRQTVQQTDTTNKKEQVQPVQQSQQVLGEVSPKPSPRARKPRRIPTTATDILNGLAIPPELNTPDGIKAVREWLEHKDRIRNQYASKDSFGIELSRWAKLGAERFAVAVRYSIGKEWKGIYEESTNGKSGQQQLFQPRGVKHGDAIADRL